MKIENGLFIEYDLFRVTKKDARDFLYKNVLKKLVEKGKLDNCYIQNIRIFEDFDEKEIIAYIIVCDTKEGIKTIIKEYELDYSKDMSKIEITNKVIKTEITDKEV